ncbi:glutathione S-transferase [Vibrio taketomensis]|uniref:glutathione S-transferase n=1 Tax=Vibrio taketomensis TaxID=2572923 RepID=UPI0013898851|nr:glutathione S-transferase [Vibrio taketomensis]
MGSDLSPILYSLHNCPYAIRARLALLKAKQRVAIRSIKLSNKPSELLAASPKGTVPVLIIQQNSSVIDQSIKIMIWALIQSDPDNLLQAEDGNALPAMISFIQEFERIFIPALNAFGCAKRYHEDDTHKRRNTCQIELLKLEECLTQHAFLFSNTESLVDIALLPFIRKYARIDKQYFRYAPYPKLRAWLNRYLQSPLFSKVMKNYDLWQENQREQFLG